MKFLYFLLLVFLLRLKTSLVSAGGESSDAVVILMAFKRYSVQSDPNGYLTSWDPKSPSPCSWRGINCSSDGRITALDLSNFNLIGPLRIDLLMPLQHLQNLNLRGNYFSVPSDLSHSKLSPSSSCNLETLDLSSNNLSDPISQVFLGSCGRLTSLNLSRNSIPGGSFSVGPSLQYLDLSRNLISDYHLFNYSLSNCLNLNLLNFSDNKLIGKLPSFSLSSCKNLATLDLSYNLFSGVIPPNFIIGTSKAESPLSLKFVDLSHNNFSGKFSSFQVGDCGNLTELDLSHNVLSSVEFPPILTNCHLLEKLDLSHNSLQTKIPPVLGSLKNLKYLSLAKNHLFGEIPPDLGRTCGTLTELDLSGNRLKGGFPSTFVSCSSLKSLNLGDNLLSGDFLSTVISTLPSVTNLYVPFNNITGSIPKSLTNCTQLQVLDLSSNEFTGNVPSWFCSSTTSSLQKILLPDNFLSGSVPSELGNCKNLKTLDLSFNMLSGSIPSQVWELPNLSDLVIWASNLTGEIPKSICGNGGNLETLILNNNFITGTIPESLASCTNLVWVSLSTNKLTGKIPSGIGNLKNLAVLQLGNNSLIGEIPSELGNCQSLIWLDLNSNVLSGSIPPELANQAGFITPGPISGKLFAFVRNEGGTACRGAGGLVEYEGIRSERLAGLPMVHSCPSTRVYTGKTVYSFTKNGSMIYLDLSYNSLSGTIPGDFGSMHDLQVLNLGHNNLTGTIPDSLGGLKQLGVLDLSHNNLEGFIPGALGTDSFLSDLDVSNNNLTGPIPSTGQLTTFAPSRYENNSGLCGVPLPPCGTGTRTRPSNLKSRGKRQSMAVGVIIGILLALFFILGLTLVLYRMKSRQGEDKGDKYIESLPTSGSSSWKLSGALEPPSINIATFEKPLRKLTFAHLLEATNGFSADSMIGSGGFGEVYKARLSDGCVVAIKKLIHVTGQGEREFTAEMETIGKIKHRNLVPLLGYCKIGEERLLVYEYMKWGSLETVLQDSTKGGTSKLDWAARKKIAIGSARGLAFLHHSCIPHIIHRDMKSSNVLLDENFEARVSDFGMARLMNALDTHLSVSTLAGTPGYVPPEYYQSFRCTTKGDVYSYGVILLELLSGKRPIDPSVFGDDNNLVGWAKQLQREKRTSEIADPELMRHESDEAEIYQYLKIAFECLDDRPFRRPTMIQVMAMFKELQMDSESDILDGFSIKDTVIEESREKEP